MLEITKEAIKFQTRFSQPTTDISQYPSYKLSLNHSVFIISFAR